MSSKTARKPLSLAARLTLLYALALLVLVGVFVGAVRWSLWAADERGTFEGAEEAIDRLHTGRELVAALAPAGDAAPYVRIIRPDGVVLYESKRLREAFPAERWPGTAGTAAGKAVRTEAVSPEGVKFSLLTAEREGWTYHVAVDRSGFYETEMTVYRHAGPIAGGLFLASLVIGYAVAKVGLRPVRVLTERVRSIETTKGFGGVGGDSGALVDLGEAARLLPGELGPLARSFEEAFGRLREAHARLDEFAGDVAHELRTPLQRIRGDAERALARDDAAAMRGALGAVVEETEELARLIERLLLLARLDDPRRGVQLGEVRVTEELENVREFFEPAAAEAGVGLQVEAPAGLTWRLDRALFQRAISNLAANAIAHGPRGSRVVLRAEAEGGRLAVSVEDEGAGIAPEAMPRVFERFFRGSSTAVAGTGLGLAIARKIAEVHGGDLTLRSRPEGGTAAKLAFPAG